MAVLFLADKSSPAVLIAFITAIIIRVRAISIVQRHCGSTGAGVVLVFIAIGMQLTSTLQIIIRSFPPNTGEFGHFGWSGILRGAGGVLLCSLVLTLWLLWRRNKEP